MAENKRKTGEEYERRAGAYLAENGYEILEYNFRCRTSEIDIIARDGEYIVFCEVKYRSGTGSGRPEEAVDFRKQKAISKCALYYIASHGLSDLACRFDVVCFEGDTVTLYKDAFDYAGA
jgi:putative endonuclease